MYFQILKGVKGRIIFCRIYIIVNTKLMFYHNFLTKDFLIDYGCSAQLLMRSMTFVVALRLSMESIDCLYNYLSKYDRITHVLDV